MQQPSQVNPLTEASSTSLEELFSRDPLGLSDQDLDVIVAKLREERMRWQLAEAAGAKVAPKATTQARLAKKVGGAVPSILADLGLDKVPGK